MNDYYNLDTLRKRLNRAGYSKVHIVDLVDSVFVCCFDVLGKFHYTEVPIGYVYLLPQSAFTLVE